MHSQPDTEKTAAKSIRVTSYPTMISLLFLTRVSVALATTYYIDANGSDGGSGTQTSPWMSPNAIMESNILKTGDVVQFCGEIKGTIETKVDYVTWVACASGATLSNSVSINGSWVPHNDKVYKIPLDAKIESLLVDGEAAILARYPNVVNPKDRKGSNPKEWLFAVNNFPMDNTTWQTEPLGRPLGYWNGAIVRARSINWIYESSFVKASTENSLTFDPPMTFTPPRSSVPGFYLEGKLEELDQPGEWFSDGKTLYYYPDGDITKMKFEYIPKGVIMTISNNHQVVQGLTFSSAQGGVSLSPGVDSILIKNNVIRGMTQFGISGIGNFTNVTVRGNEISEVLRHGIFLAHGCNGGKVIGNYIHDMGLVAGYGPARGMELPEGTPTVYGNVAIYVSGTVNDILNNKIARIGYHGIQTSGGDKLATYSDSFRVNCSYNVVDSVCLVLSDCGAIYSRETHDSVLVGNVVANAVGNGVAAGKSLGVLSHGMYVDEMSTNITVLRNTAYNISVTGLYIHRVSNVVVKDNVVVDCGLGKQIRPTGTNKMVDNVYLDNVYSVSRVGQEFALQQGGNEAQTPLLAKHQGEMYCASGALSANNDGQGNMFSVDGKTYTPHAQWAQTITDVNVKPCSESDKSRLEAEVVRVKSVLTKPWTMDSWETSLPPNNGNVPSSAKGVSLSVLLLVAFILSI
jgi:hypothetical protein